MARKNRKAPKFDAPQPDWLPERADRRESEILGAAYDVFVTKGFHRATMLDIATRARASKETLYARFGNKENLFKALLSWGASARQPSMTALAAAEPADAEDALRQAGIQLLTLFYRPESLALERLRLAEGPHHAEIRRVIEEVAVRPVREGLAAFFGKLVRAGLIPLDQVHAAAESYIDVLRGVYYLAVVVGDEAPPGEEKIRHIAGRAARVALKSFAAPARP